jgi:hypothetical protein
MNLKAEIEKRVAVALAEWERHIRPRIEDQVRLEYEEWKRDNPRLRVCYLCKRSHRRPHLLFVVDSRGRHRRWVSRKCFEKKVGYPLNDERGFRVWQLHV